jgi:hypothetical protein
VPEPSPQEWLERLYAKLRRQRIHARRYDRYYSGESKLEIVTRDFREVFEGLFNPVRVNLCRVAVDVTMERLEVDGFVVGDDDNQAGADEAHRIWLANDLDVMSAIGHIESAIKGTAFTLTWPDANDDPVISVEDPEEMAIARRSSPPYDVIAALKVWTDEWDGIERADLYLPDAVRRYRRDRTRNLPGRGAGWAADTFDGGEDELPNPYDGVPVVEISDRQRLLKPPQSRLLDVAPLQDGSDKILADLIIAASFGAVPVRTATGLEFKTNSEGKPVDAQGNPVRPFDVRADRVWISPKAESKFGTLEGSSLEGFVAARKAILGAYRTATRVPLNYVGELEGTSHLTGEAVKALENPLVRLINSTAKRVGPGWAKTMQFALAGTDFSDASVRTRWADTETKVEAQQADAANKAKEMGVPLEVVLERILGWPREVIRRTLAVRAREGGDLDELLKRLEKDLGEDDVDEPESA